MNTFTVSFFGHRDFSEHYLYEDKLIEIIKDLIRTKEYVEFLVGRNGEFDIFATSCVRVSCLKRTKYCIINSSSMV